MYFQGTQRYIYRLRTLERLSYKQLKINKLNWVSKQKPFGQSTRTKALLGMYT